MADKMKSIIFNQHQVNHALKNKEGMFRVVVKGNELEISHPAIHSWKQSPNDGRFYAKAKNDETKQQYVTTFPFYGIKSPFEVGETIFVKETFVKDFDKEGNPIVKYKADSDLERRWNPPLGLPQWASRLNLRIKSVKVERLADISEEDAIKEGFSEEYDNYFGECVETESAKDKFQKLWNSTHKKPEEKFEANPFCFVYEYEVVR